MPEPRWRGDSLRARNPTASPTESPCPDTARTPALFRHRRPAAAEASGGRSRRRLDHRQPGVVGHRAADAARRADPADGPAADAGRAELGLARIRDARRRLALLRTVRGLGITPTAAVNGADGASTIRASRQAMPRRRMGVRAARLRAAPDADRGRPAGRDRSARIDAIEKVAGKRPIGWLAPGMSQTFETPDHLAAAGFKYTADYVHDDEPSWIETAHGRMVTLPYTFEMNDITMMALQDHEARHFYERGVDQFEQLYKEAEIARRSCRSRCTPICPASRTASCIWKNSTATSRPSPASRSGPANRFINGTRRAARPDDGRRASSVPLPPLAAGRGSGVAGWRNAGLAQ